MNNCVKRALHNSEESFSIEDITLILDAQTGLGEVFTNQDISNITKVLAHNYIMKNFNLDYNELGESITNISLKEFIPTELKEKISYLRNLNDEYFDDIADSLEDTLEFSDEWLSNVKNYFNSLKLNYEESEISELEETGREDLIRKPSFERSSKEGISANVKLRLSLLTDPNQTDDIFNQPIFIPLQETLSTLQKTLSNDVTTIDGGVPIDLYKSYVNKIKKLANKKPYLWNLVKILEDPNLPSSFQTEFTQAFTLSKNNYLTTTINTLNEFEHNVKNVSDVNSKRNIVLNNWKVLFTYSFLEDNKLNKDTLNKNIDVLKDYRNKLVKESKLIKNKSELKTLVQDFIDLSKNIGIDISNESLDYYLNDLQNEDVSLDKYLVNLNNLSVSYLRTLNDINNNKISLFDKDGNFKNPFNYQSDIKNLAKAEAFFIIDGNDESIRSDGKNKWVYSYPSYLSNKINSWKKDRNLLEKLYRSTPYTKSSKYMEYLLAYDRSFQTEEMRINESNKRIDKLELGIFNSLQNENDDELGVSNVDMSINDAKSDIINKVLSYKKGAKTYVNTPTPADKSTQYQLHIGYNIDYIPNFNGEEVSVSDGVAEIFYNYYKSEYYRIDKVFKEIETLDSSDLVVHYHTGRSNGKKSQLFPSISNTDNMVIFDENGKPILEDLDVVKNELISLIKTSLQSKILDTHSKLLESGVVEASNGRILNVAIDKDIWSKYSLQTNMPSLAIAANFYINGVISNVEYSKMFSGDVAFYKNIVDYKKRVPATYTDGLQVRLLEDDSPFFNVAVIDGVEIKSPYYDKLKEYLPKNILKYYDNINSTDAQAWITPDRWKFLISRTIGWSDLYESAYNKMIDGGEFTPLELKKVAQPLKGVYFDINNGIPTFLKYSQAVLLPSLVKGSELESIYNKMINEKIDELITIDGVKVGALSPTKIHNEEGSVSDNIEFNTFSLNQTGWKLQQNLPTKTFKETQVGSQIQKNILEGVAHNLNETFELNGEELSGLEIYKQINKTVGDLSDIGMNEIINSFGIENNKITNPDRFYGAMIQELKERGENDNLIKALEAGITPYGIAQNQQKLMNIFFAIVNKKIVKIKTNGGSFIQLSNFGIDRVTAESQGVKWISEAKPLSPYQIYEENGKTKVKPAQILISGSFIAKYIPDYKKYSGEELKKLIDPKILQNVIGYRIPNQGLSSNDALEIVGILPEEVGDTVVAYTEIPTKTGSDFDIDKMYIMIPSYKLKSSGSLYNKAINFVKNNLELNREDLINELLLENYIDSFNNDLTYNELLKMYVDNILLNPESNSEVKDEFDLLIDKSEVKGLEYINSSGNSKKAKQNKLIELYKSVLLHPNNIVNVMTPIDFEYVKNDIIDLHPPKPTTDLDDFSVLDDIDLKYEFLAGKAGLGQVVNALVDHIRGLFTETSLNGIYIGWGHKNTVGDTKLDLEFSETLDGTKFRISDTLSAFTNAYVDIAKDPYVTRGNFVTQTTNTATMMIRAGVHPFVVNAFIGQPILKDYVKFITFNESKIKNSTSNLRNRFLLNKVKEILDSEGKSIDIGTDIINYSDIFQKEITSVQKEGININVYKLLKDYDVTQDFFQEFENAVIRISEVYNSIFNHKNYDVTELSLNKLRSQIKDDIDLDIQLSIFNKFIELQDLSKVVRDSVDASKIDVNGAGKNITSLIISDNKIKDILSKSDEAGFLSGFEDKLFDPSTGESTILGNYKNNIIDNINNIIKANPKYFLISNQNVIDTFNIISQDVKGSILKDDRLGTLLEEEFYTYIMSNLPALRVDNKVNYIAEVLDDVAALKNDKEFDNYFINELEIKSSATNTFIGINNSAKSNDYSTKLTESWLDLFYEKPEIASKLATYSFITSGFKPSLNSFYQYIPYQFFIASKINEYVINTGNNIKDIDLNFIDQLYKNNSDNSLLVPQVFSNNIKYDRKDGFTLQDGIPRLYVTPDKSSLYKLMGYDIEGKAIYIKTNKLGYKSNIGKINGYDMSLEYNDNIPSDVVTPIELISNEDTINLKIEDQVDNDPFKCE